MRQWRAHFHARPYYFDLADLNRSTLLWEVNDKMLQITYLPAYRDFPKRSTMPLASFLLMTSALMARHEILLQPFH